MSNIPTASVVDPAAVMALYALIQAVTSPPSSPTYVMIVVNVPDDMRLVTNRNSGAMVYTVESHHITPTWHNKLNALSLKDQRQWDATMGSDFNYIMWCLGDSAVPMTVQRGKWKHINSGKEESLQQYGKITHVYVL